MTISRRDLEEAPRPSLSFDEERKLRSEVELANSLIAMTGTIGWKQLVNKFISPRMEYSALMTVPDEGLASLRAEHRALHDMLKFIERSIENGTRAHERLLKNK